MAKNLTEAEIASLLGDRKPLTTAQLRSLLNPKAIKQHRGLRSTIKVKSDQNRKFEIVARLSPEKELDFSVLVFYLANTRTRYQLIRCNGPYHGQHPNRLEINQKSGIQFVPPEKPHIHYLTERYQLFNKPNAYAVQTEEFYTFKEAVEFLCDSFGFCVPTCGYDDKYPLFNSRK